MVASGGGRSQISQLTTSVIVLLVLLFLTGPLAYLPTAVLSAIVFLVALKMIDIKGMRRIFIEARAEFWVALLTAATVVVVGVEQGIVLAMVLSLLDHVRRGYRGTNTVIAADKRKKGWQMVPLNPPQQIAPGLLVYCFSHSLYYANCAQFSEEVLRTGKDPGTPAPWIACASRRQRLATWTSRQRRCCAAFSLSCVSRAFGWYLPTSLPRCTPSSSATA
jgi:SulP family sulfate permease